MKKYFKIVGVVIMMVLFSLIYVYLCFLDTVTPTELILKMVSGYLGMMVITFLITRHNYKK